MQGRGWLSRTGWFVALWTGSVMALLVVALLFRFAMNAAGLTSS